MQKAILKSNRFSLPITWILLFGLVIRVLFILKGGSVYYGKEDFWLMGGDTHGWMNSFLNLLNHGVYTSNPDIENAKFFRPPGYSFAMGIVYLLCGKDLAITYKALIWLQTFFDIITIYLIYKIAIITTKNKLISYISAFLYATYPFVIVWVPILYAESFSLFFMIAGLYFFIKSGSEWKYFWAAFLTGLAALCRLQCLPLLPVMLLVILISRENWNVQLKRAFLFSIGILLGYGLWPIRNYINHDRFVLTEDVDIGGHWSHDYFALMDFLFATQVDVEPQWSQILTDQEVSWPSNLNLDSSEKNLLDSLTVLLKQCGTGVSYFRYYSGLNYDTILPGRNCDSAIEAGFKLLTANQKEKNKFNHYIKVPAGNVKKAFFKSALYGNKSPSVKMIAIGIFGYRTLLLFVGIAGLYFAWRKKLMQQDLLFIILFYFLGWYGFMCIAFRHLEIRYFLHADLLLLFPAACLIGNLLNSSSVIRQKNSRT